VEGGDGTVTDVLTLYIIVLNTHGEIPGIASHALKRDASG